MSKKLQKNNKGFTIIEVLIVLAIAALIMLIVFLAIPALQRNQRNTSRRNDVGRVGSVSTEFLTNNNGTLPSTVAHANTIEDSAGVLSQYAATTGTIDYLTLATGTQAAFSGTAPTGLTNMRLVTGAKCDGATAGATTATGATTRSMVIQYMVESAGDPVPVCQEI